MTSEPGSAAPSRAGRIAVVGAGTPLGGAVLRRAAASPGVAEVLAVDLAAGEAPPDCRGLGFDLGSSRRRSGPSAEALADALGPIEQVLLLADPAGRRVTDAAGLVLDAAGRAGATHAVVLSSALAYGARPDNPVPLTEDAPLRPNRGVAVAHGAARLEELVRAWVAAGDPTDPGGERRAALLRPTVVVAEGANGALAQALRRSPAVPAGAEEPPAQFLHLEDLVEAIDLARRDRLDGAFNVAPEGWIDGETVRALAGGLRVAVPGWFASAVVRTGWRWGVGATPPELLPYLRHPWVVASDRLRAAGWVPRHSSAEAYVEAHRGGPLATVSPQRRQELALGASAAVIAGAAAGAVALVRRRRR